MVINLTRNEVLNLMQELPVNYWFQPVLLQELATQQETPLGGRTRPVRAVEPLVAPVIAQEPTGACEWECYGLTCGKNTYDNRYCADHTDKVCSVCQNPATHGCNVELQFVCGGPLCPAHTRCKGH